MVRIKNIKNQLPMEFMLPDVDWVPPTSLPDMRGEGDLVFDVETKDDGLIEGRGPSWPMRQGWICGISIASRARSVYAPIRHPDSECLDKEMVGDWVRTHLHRGRDRGRIIFQNGPYDIGWIWAEWGIEPPDEVDDTIAMAFTIDENRLNYSLDSLAHWRGVPGKDEQALRHAADAYGLHPKKELWKLPARFVGPYAEQDGTTTLGVFDSLHQELTTTVDNQGISLEPAYRLEADLIPMVFAMRRRGVRVNLDQAERSQKILTQKRDSALRTLTENIAIGRTIGIDDLRSNKFLSGIFESVNSRLPSDQRIAIPRTDKDNESFTKDWMKDHDHWLPSTVARALAMDRAANLFLGEFIMGFTHMGRIHAEIHQYRDSDSDEASGGTRTTRFAYANPPLQQMPSRDEEIAPIIRACFEPEEGQIWAAVDYSQQEFRLMVHFASLLGIPGVEKAVEIYNRDPDTDFHNMVVEITNLPRRRAKDVNFAKAFGAGPPKFALMTGMTLDEAKEAMSEYDERLPWMKGLSERCQKRVDQKGFIRMIDGFRSRFDRWEPRWIDWKKVREAQSRDRSLRTEPCSLREAQARKNDPNHPWYGVKLRRAFTHKALNSLIQGSAARQMKMAMREVWREGMLPLLQMHDELDLSVREEREAMRVSEIMRDVVKLEIPVKCDVEFGVNWGRAAKEERRKPDGTKEVVYRATWSEAIAELEKASD